jgi:ABC-2 type transport system ATP-binding protein
MLKITNLTKKFGANTAVNNVSFSVRAGEIFALIGPNGSGKTTIIKIIAGLLQSTKGEVKVNGFDVGREATKAKAQIGYIPDEPSIWPAMTGGEFLNFIGALYGLEEKVREQKIPEMLATFNLGNIAQEYFEDYSRGNKQKFSILAALLHKPKLLLIDEPIVGLDPASAVIAKQKFTEFAQSGGAILMATHTLPVAQEIAHQIGVLTEGRLMAVGSFADLIRKANLKEGASFDDIYRALT